MKTQSKYAEKVARGNQMYGPGCCAHKITDSQIQKAKQAAADRGHFGGFRKG